MNRRSFFSTLAKAAIGFTILPPATTYVRRWVKGRVLWEIAWEDVQIGYRANAIGIYQQLKECRAVVDPPGDDEAARFLNTIYTRPPRWRGNQFGPTNPFFL